MLSSGSGYQFCSPSAVLLWSWLFAVLIYWRLVSLPHPLSLRQGQWSISQPPAVSLWWFTVCQFCRALWLWVLLTGSGDEFWGLYLLYFRQSVFLPFQPFVAPPPFSSVLSAFQHSRPLCCVLVFSSLFIAHVFFCGGFSLPRRLCRSVLGVAGGIPHDTWSSPAWSAKCLPGSFGARHPTCFLSIMWHGEALYRLGVQVVEVLVLLGALFLPNTAPASQQGLWFMELPLLYASCHLGSSLHSFF
jgi:hypothetical protein